VDRGKQADLEVEALDRGPGRTEENGLEACPALPGGFREKFERDFAQKEDEVHQ